MTADGAATAHSRFFDRLVELIPARYYHLSDAGADAGRLAVHGLSKSAKRVLKQQFKQHAKANKRAKLDPSVTAGTDDVYGSAKWADGEAQGPSSLDTAAGKRRIDAAPSQPPPSLASLPRPELKARLASKLEVGRVAGDVRAVSAMLACTPHAMIE
jgi:hypothetical protein